MKYLARSVYVLYSVMMLLLVKLFIVIIKIITTKDKQSNTVSSPTPGRALAKKSQFDFWRKKFLDDSGRVRPDLSIERCCPVCSARNYKHFCFSQDGFEYVVCSNCSMIYTTKILTPKAYRIFQEQLAESEKMWASEREEDKNADKKRFFRYIQMFKKYVYGGRKLLDIGCFTGVFLECAKDAGFSPSGVEIHEDKATVAARKGFPVKVGDFENLDVGEVYQVVTLWESLEHMNNPRLVVQKVRSILSDQGIIVFTVPNGDALSVKVLSHHLVWLTGSGHKNMFTPSAVVYLLRDNGFELVELRTIGGPYMGAIVNYFQDRIGSLDSFQNWDRLESGVHQPSSARLLELLIRPVIEHYNYGDLIFVIGRKT